MTPVSQRLADLSRHVAGEFQVAFGVHLRDVERLVAKASGRRFDAEHRPDLGGGGVPQLIRKPMTDARGLRRPFDRPAVAVPRVAVARGPFWILAAAVPLRWLHGRLPTGPLFPVAGGLRFAWREAERVGGPVQVRLEDLPGPWARCG